MSSGADVLNDFKLPAYLFYHRFANDDSIEYRYHTTLSKEKCDEYKKEFESGNNTHGHPVHMDLEIIENWFPKTFSERVDAILLHLSSLAKHVGQSIEFSNLELFSLLFIERKEVHAFTERVDWRGMLDCSEEATYMLEYLESSSYIKCNTSPQDLTRGLSLRITPKGYSRIDELQKNTSFGKCALVAMKFGDDTKPLREAIRKGIQDAGYVAVFIDEVQHNDFITPELLKHIRDSKFVVVDLTHQNNGAYFEEGYAMGLGKPVIQLCKRHVQLHFDIAQKNTIMWDTENDIPERLTNRIKATID